jgi:hypothetical protein
MRNLADSGAFWAGLFVVLIVMFMLPTLIGMIRGVDALALVFLVNLIGAPVLIGWPAAMILAFGPRRRLPEPPQLPRPEPMWWPEGTWTSDPHDLR